jgi:hypothetical protein
LVLQMPFAQPATGRIVYPAMVRRTRNKICDLSERRTLLDGTEEAAHAAFRSRVRWLGFLEHYPFLNPAQ